MENRNYNIALQICSLLEKEGINNIDDIKETIVFVNKIVGVRSDINFENIMKRVNQSNISSGELYGRSKSG